MLFRILQGSQNPVVDLILISVGLIFAISIHEFAHAFVAFKLGDPTAKSLGRITLNPKAHLDPLGTVMLLLVGLGWGKPVPFDPYYLKNPKRDSALISLAGPVSNILLAIIFSAAFHLLPSGSLLSFVSEAIVYFNLLLAIFNLIPVHPLDGFKVVNGLLPQELSYQWMQMAPYGMWILLILIFTGITGTIIGPSLAFALKLLGF